MAMTLQEIIEAVASGISDVARKPNINNYVPNRGGQAAFHKSSATGRLLAGDNRSGKTVAGIVESIWWATGRHPYQKTPEPPVFGRIITVDFEYGADQIIVPKLRQWIPPSELIDGSWDKSYNSHKHLLTFANGSKIEIKAHGQKLDSFAGTPRHFLHVDEECPKAIFIESKARLLDYNGRYWITMTPVEGITWVYRDLVEEKSENVEVFEIDIRDNKSISEEAIEKLAADLSEEERKIRLGGGKVNWTPRGGLVFKHFDRERHVIPAGLPPKYCTFYISIDHGLNNPTAVLWHALYPDGKIVTFFEHYRSEWTVNLHANRIKEVNEGFGIVPNLVVGDPSMDQRNAITGHSVLLEYRRQGIPVMPGKKHKDNAYIDRMNEYLRRDMWHITDNCTNLIREMSRLPWKVYRSPKIADQNNRREEPLEKDDHAVDSAGYFFNFMPELKGKSIEEATQLQMTSFDREPLVSPTQYNKRQYPWRIDRTLLNRKIVDPDNLAFGEIP